MKSVTAHLTSPYEASNCPSYFWYTLNTQIHIICQEMSVSLFLFCAVLTAIFVEVPISSMAASHFSISYPEAPPVCHTLYCFALNIRQNGYPIRSQNCQIKLPR